MEKKNFQRLIHMWMEEKEKKAIVYNMKEEKRKGEKKEKEKKKKRENEEGGVLSSHSTRACPRILFIQIYAYNSFLLTL